MGGGRILRYPSREIPLMAAGPAVSQASHRNEQHVCPGEGVADV
jgi:hypothetical protein